MQQSNRNTDIAVVGMACYYPGAKTPLELWENILARRQQFRKMPDCRLPNADYYNSDPAVPDMTYLDRAAVIDGYEYDWMARRTPKKTVESTDIVHWLALDTALAAVADAGLTKETIAREKAGVILGNTLTGEFTRAETMRLRWPFVRRALRASAAEKGLHGGQLAELEHAMEHYYKSVFPEITEDTLAGGLANTVAGRICNYLDMHGGGYIVDGACSSSLIAIKTAATYLADGEMDLAITGGVDISLDTFELIGFAKTGALTQTDMHVYDKKGKGFIPGEGCGMVVLKRLEDARRDGDYVYATLKGWAVSSDGKGGITAPSSAGQARALSRAYRKAGIDPKTLDFIEGHGTGTAVGDRTELEGIALALNTGGTATARSCGVTSFKSIVGHTKAAAGVGAFIKTVIAVNRRVMPATAGCNEPHTVFADKALCLYPVLQGAVRSANETLRAGVSAMGFGGINCHVVVESADAPSDRLRPVIEERKLLASRQSSEVFMISAASQAALLERVGQLLTEAAGISVAELTDMAAHVNSQNGKVHLPYRAAIVAGSPAELMARLEELVSILSRDGVRDGVAQTYANGNILVAHSAAAARVGMLFTGQGSQQLNMARVLVERHEWARQLLQVADDAYCQLYGEPLSPRLYKTTEQATDEDEIAKWREDLKQTQAAQPAIVLASLLWYRFLSSLGVSISAVAGHSLGELTAFHAAGAMDEGTLLRVAALRGKAMGACGTGDMLSLACGRREAGELMRAIPGYLTIANINSPRQTVVSGEKEPIEQLRLAAAAINIRAVRLPVSAAFHSNLVAEASEALRSSDLLDYRFFPADVVVVSGMDGKPVHDNRHLAEHFATQLTSEVRFVAAVETMQQYVDIIIEAGPGRILTNLAAEIAPSVPCFPVESQAGGDRDISIALANLFVRGVKIDSSALYADRLVRPFVAARQRKFLVAPLERPFPALEKLEKRNGGVAAIAAPAGITQAELDEYLAERRDFIFDVIRADMRSTGRKIKPMQSTGIPVATSEPKPALKASSRSLILDIISSKTGFPIASLRDDQRLLEDLNLDSIKSSTVISEIALATNTEDVEPLRLSNASIGELVTYFNSADNTIVTRVADGYVDVRSQVINLISERTGFPVAMIADEMRLLDDLNMDSIKAGSLVADIARAVGIAVAEEPVKLANASVAELVKVFSAAPAAVLPYGGSSSAREVVYELISKVSGFPAHTLADSMKLLDDLNLDSIKASGIIADAMSRLNVATVADPLKMANASIAELIAALEEQGKAAQPVLQLPVKGIDKSGAWTRNFTRVLMREDLPGGDLAAWRNKRVALLAAAPAYLQQLQAQLAGLQVQTVALSYEDIEGGKRLDAKEYDFLIACLSPACDSNDIANSVQELSLIARQPMLGADSSCAVVLLEADAKTGAARISGASSFAASLHLECPQLIVRHVQLPAMDAVSIDIVAAELASGGSFTASVYDENMLRHVATYEVIHPSAQVKRSVQLSAEDVVLVTGGARGITAECAIALGKKYGCKLALAGSSRMDAAVAGAEIGATLDRLAAANVTARYYCCDITDKDALAEMMNAVACDLGGITAIVHGAAVNKARRAATVTAEEALQEIAPKLKGAMNLIELTENNELKLFCAFTSIIGVSGMMGNAWYAYSNETLDRLLRVFKEKHPATSTLTLAYSVWDEVGMGAKMGSAHQLGRLGIRSIPVADGISCFEKCLEYTAAEQQVVIAASINAAGEWQLHGGVAVEQYANGALDTFRRRPVMLPRVHNFIDAVRYAEYGVEVTTEYLLTLDKDRYVRDHEYNGSYLFPTVFGLEAMAQTVALVTGSSFNSSLRIEDIKLERPITVGPKGTLLRINAIVQEPDDAASPQKVRVAVYTDLSQFKQAHFSATFCIDATNELGKCWTPTDADTGIVPKRDLYGNILFQGPVFQQIGKVYDLRDGNLYFRSAVNNSDKYLLGDPFYRDTLLQSGQLLVPHLSCLPVHIGALTINKTPAKGERGRNVHTTLDGVENRTVYSTVAAFDDYGVCRELLENYQTRVLREIKDGPSTRDIVSPSARDNRLLQHAYAAAARDLGLDAAIALEIAIDGSFAHKERQVRRHAELPVLQRAVAGISGAAEPADIRWTDNNRPEVAGGGAYVSLSHVDNVCLVAAANCRVGVDLEYSDREEGWQGLLPADGELISTLMQGGDSAALAGARVWTAKEAAIKLCDEGIGVLTAAKRSGSGVLFSYQYGSVRAQIVTFPITLTLGRQRMVAVALEQIDTPPTGRPLNTISPDGVFVTRFLPTFKDCRSLSGRSYFTSFAAWMGQIRELALLPVSARLVADMSSGEWGMVTNDSGMRIVGDVVALEEIEGRVWLAQSSDLDRSYIALEFEWCKVEDTRFITIAKGFLNTTWVRITGHGTVETAPIPAYFRSFLLGLGCQAQEAVAGDVPYSALVNMGAQRYKTPPGPRPELLLAKLSFHTGLDEGNSVGNIYYSNYYSWQAKVRDAFLYKAMPGTFVGKGEQGEFVCTNTTVQHLQEAMPFDTVEVAMYLSELYEHGMVLYFEYYSTGAEGNRRKLAFGSHTAVWSTVHNGRRTPAGIPSEMHAAITRKRSEMLVGAEHG